MFPLPRVEVPLYVYFSFPRGQIHPGDFNCDIKIYDVSSK